MNVGDVFSCKEESGGCGRGRPEGGKGSVLHSFVPLPSFLSSLLLFVVRQVPPGASGILLPISAS